MPYTIATEMEIDDEFVHFTVILSQSQTRGQDFTHAIEVWFLAPGDECRLGRLFGMTSKSGLTVRIPREQLQCPELSGNKPYLLVKHAAYEREPGAPLMEFGTIVANGVEKVYLDPTVFD